MCFFYRYIDHIGKRETWKNFLQNKIGRFEWNRCYKSTLTIVRCSVIFFLKSSTKVSTCFKSSRPGLDCATIFAAPYISWCIDQCHEHLAGRKVRITRTIVSFARLYLLCQLDSPIIPALAAVRAPLQASFFISFAS